MFSRAHDPNPFLDSSAPIYCCFALFFEPSHLDFLVRQKICSRTFFTTKLRLNFDLVPGYNFASFSHRTAKRDTFITSHVHYCDHVSIVQSFEREWGRADTAGATRAQRLCCANLLIAIRPHDGAAVCRQAHSPFISAELCFLLLKGVHCIAIMGLALYVSIWRFPKFNSQTNLLKLILTFLVMSSLLDGVFRFGSYTRKSHWKGFMTFKFIIN